MASSPLVPADTRRALNATDPRWKFKTNLHVLTLIASIIAIALFASSIPLWNANLFHSSGPNRGDWTDGISLGPLAFTFLASLITLAYSTATKRPFPPKITMTTTVLILISLAPALIVAGEGSLFKHLRPSPVSSQSGVLKCNLTNIFTRQCEPILFRISELEISGIAFGTITWFLVFITFLVSLYEHRASQIADARNGRDRGLKRLTLMVSGHGRRGDLEKGMVWPGNGSGHSHTSSTGSRSGYGSRQHRYPKGREHRQHGTRKHYRSGVKDGSGDVVPFMYVQEPESLYPHPGTRYM